MESLEEDICRGFSGLSRDGLDIVVESHLKTLESESETTYLKLKRNIGDKRVAPLG
jgi:hypothetical protein